MFDWLAKKGREALVNECKAKVDECRNKLDLALSYYYNNHFLQNAANTKTNKNGIERLYLFMCVAFGYLYGELNKFKDDPEVSEYFISYTPVRIISGIENPSAAQQVFSGYNIGAENIGSLPQTFGYAGGIISMKMCPLSNAAARTGGHMLNCYTKNKTVIQADQTYSKFREMGSLLRDGDKAVSGLQVVFDNSDLTMHNLKIN